MSTVKGILAGLAVVAALLVAACVTPGPVGDHGGDLSGTSWVLSSMPGANGATMPVPSRPQVTLQFRDGGSLGGSGGCNLFGGSYRTDGNRINISQLYSTLMYCEEAGVSERESAYFRILGEARTYRIEGDSLRFFDGAGAGILVFTRAPSPVPLPLSGTHWVLESISSGEGAVSSVMAGTRLDAVFTENGSVSGSAGCNGYFASYTAAGSSLDLGPVGATKKFCTEPSGIMIQEQAFLSLLARVTGYGITGDQLVLRDSGGNGLLWFRGETGS